MKKALFLTISILFLACSKNQNQPQQVTKNQTVVALEAHTWLLDSLQARYPDSIYTIVESEPKLGLAFNDDTMFSYIPTHPLPDKFLYEFQEPNKLYRWLPQNGKDTSNYSIIDTITASLLVLRYNFSTYTEYDFFHAK